MEINIIYSDKALESYAVAFAQSLTAKGNAEFKARLDTECEPLKKEILIGKTNRIESAEICEQKPLCYEAKSVNGKLVIKTGGEHSLSKFLTTLADIDTEILLGDEELEISGNYFDDPYDSSRHENADLRIMTANVMANADLYNNCKDKISIAAREEIFHANIDYYAPDIIGVQEFCMECHAELEKYHAIDRWEILKFLNPHPQYATHYVYSTIMYRKDLLTLIDSGMQYYSKYNNSRCRCMTWGIFRINKTGKEFAFVSTHWDGQNMNQSEIPENTRVQVNEVAELTNALAKDRPVFTMGDLNSNEWTTAIKTYIAAIDSFDCMHADESVRLNIAGSWHDWAQGKASAGSCDHITATKKDTEVLKFETLMYNEQIYSSDHAWLGVDIKFK